MSDDNENNNGDESQQQNSNGAASDDDATLLNDADDKSANDGQTQDKKGDGDQQKASGDDQDSQKKDGDGDKDQKAQDSKADSKFDADAPADVSALKIPEGFQKDEEIANAFQEIANELDLTNGQAQKLVELQAKAIEQGANSAEAEFQTQVKKWEAEAKKDETIGGIKFEENVAVARKAILAFGDEELGQAFKLTGIGSHPAMLRFAYKIGQAISEDKLDLGQANSQARKSAAETLYPNMPSQAQ